MKNFKLISICIVSLLLASPASFAREFIDAKFEVQLIYSHFDQKTISAGQITGTIRRTDDHFACALTVNMKSYNCQARASIDQLAWLSVDSADYLQIVLQSIDPNLPDKTSDRIRAILKNHLENPMLLTGARYIFKNRVQMFDEKIPDVLKLTVKIY